MVPLRRVMRFFVGTGGKFFFFFCPKAIFHSNPAAANIEMAIMSVASGVGLAVDFPE